MTYIEVIDNELYEETKEEEIIGMGMYNAVNIKEEQII